MWEQQHLALHWPPPLHLLLAEVLPDGERHGGQPGPGAGHVAGDGPGVRVGVVALDGVVVAVPALLPTQHIHPGHYN